MVGQKKQPTQSPTHLIIGAFHPLNNILWTPHSSRLHMKHSQRLWLFWHLAPITVADLGGGGGGSEPPSALEFKKNINSYCRLALTYVSKFIVPKVGVACQKMQHAHARKLKPPLHKKSSFFLQLLLACCDFSLLAVTFSLAQVPS